MIDMNQMRMRTRLAFVFAGIWILGASLLVFCLYQIMGHYIHKEVQNRLGNYVAHAAMLINPEEHARLQSPEDEKGAIYAHLVKQLRDFRNQSTDIRFVYTARLNSEGKVVEGAAGFFAEAGGTLVAASEAHLIPGESSVLQPQWLAMGQGECHSQLESVDGVLYAVGCARSRGYREYKRDGRYSNDILCVVRLPI